MRITFLSTAVLAAVSLFQLGAYAQMTGNITANIPFGFHVGDKMLPAGDYTFTELATRDIEVRNDKTDKTVIQLGTSAETLEPSRNTELIFHRYGNDEYLHQIKLQGETEGIEFLPSKAEQKLMSGGQHVVMHSHPAKHNKMAKHS